MFLSRAAHSERYKNNKNKNMKVIKKKATAPVIKPVAKPAAAPAPLVKRTVNRDKVLREFTVAELEKHIGRDTKVGVSMKSLKAAVVAQNSAKLLAGLE